MAQQPFLYKHVKEKTDKFLNSESFECETANVKIIGEIGINHNGDVETAKKLIDVAVHCGCDYVKFQKRTPDVCVPEHKKETPRETPWAGEITYLNYKYDVEFEKEEYDEIDRYCREKGIGWFASVWDPQSVEFMTQYTDIGKIPSAHLTNDEVLINTRDAFETMIVSTGMSTQDQVDHAMNLVRPDVVMHSVSAYPTKVDEMNLEYVTFLKNRYPFAEVGYSGHELGIVSSAASVALGATWVERHITLDKEMWGSDQAISLEPNELQELVYNIRTVEKSLGGNHERSLLHSEVSKQKSLRKK